ncbi:E3 ubiquitin-protein ligase RNF14-like isoform X3 [Hyperolius riggenbachi]
MSSEDQEAQEDELLALASIYSEDVFKRADNVPGGEIQAFLELPPNFKVFVKSTSATNAIAENFEDTVMFLPPIILNFELPPGYPSSTPPIFTLSCKWLSPKQLSLLCQRLDDLWEENKGCVVLFAWMQFLKEGTIEYLDIKSPYEIHLGSNVMQSWMQTSEEGSPCSAAEPPEEGAVDRRAIQDVESVASLIRHILDSNEIQQKKCFDVKQFVCSICFCEKLGSECTYFKQCSHVYCNSCLKDYFEIQIKDGQVHSLNCPEIKCTSIATPGQVKALVEIELFSRYDRLLLQSSLDLMTDVVYCPRPSCRTPVMKEPVGNMGICSGCKYAFCCLCWMAYHAISPCRMTAEDIVKLRDDYWDADEEGKRFLEKKFGKKAVMKIVEDIPNLKWLKENSKACPSCASKIEKYEGCNKMACTVCKKYFCWLCLSILSADDPYKHFNDPNSVCFNK